MGHTLTMILIILAGLAGGIGLFLLFGTTLIIDLTIRQMAATGQLDEDHVKMVKPVMTGSGPAYDLKKVYSSKLYGIDNPTLQATIRMAERAQLVAFGIAGVCGALLAIGAIIR